MFDAIVVEQTVISLIERGKRNLAIDLKNVDYLYSDSINKFINLNHRVLNVYGRLAILSPGEQVSQILQRAGIQNFLKIYETDDELKRSSDEIIQQTTALSVQDIKSYREGPVSEFEDFRSEIGKAIAGTPHSAAEEIDNYAQADSAFAQPAQTDQGFAPSIEEYQPSIPTFGEVPFNPNFSPAASQFHDFRQPLAPPPPPPTSFDYSQMPSIPSFDSPPSIQPQFATPHYPDFAQPPSPPAPPEYQPQQQRPMAPLVEERKAARKFDRTMEESRFEADEFDEKKKFPMAAVLIPLILILILGGGAAYLFLFTPLKDNFNKKKVVQVETTVQKQIPQVEVKEPVVEPVQPTETTEVMSTTPKTEEEPKVTTPERKPQPVSRPVVKTTTAPKKTPSRPPATPVVTNKISFSSVPSNAKISVNGKELGKTPYTWTDPSVYGMVSISVEKDGYVSQKVNIEYTGGSISKSFELDKKKR